MKIALVGSPNVGKSAIFNKLTGSYVTVSNYPGTTVEVAKGNAKVGGSQLEIIDTPGLYSIYPVTEEERVTLGILKAGEVALVVQVADAKNIERTLPFTFQLKKLGIPIILVLNMMDEAASSGFKIDEAKLSEKVGLPVVSTVAIEGQGIDRLIAKIALFLPLSEKIKLGDLPEFSERQMRVWYAEAKNISDSVLLREKEKGGLSRLDKLVISPLTGLPILAVIIYVGFYKFVGSFGAGTVVDFLEGMFEGHINPWLQNIFSTYVPWPVVNELFVGEYGILSLGMRYAFAIILPVVTFFFYAFAVIEDSGYLPRLGFLLDRAFKRIGLSGRAIIPMVLGLGCVSMATMVTRTLPTKRERFIATLLLALCIPCAAQTGVIMGLLSTRPKVLALWATTILLVFIIVGSLSAKLLPGARPTFIMEVPPMRWPNIGNLFIKTYTRVVWYVKEVVPLFVLASVLIWIGQITGAFEWLVKMLSYPLAVMNLPRESASAFIFGFFRRDYGAAGLYDLNNSGLLDNNQLLIAAVVLTLFLPCITQFLMTIKERGLKIGVGISIFILFFAFTIGIILKNIIKIFDISL